MRGVTVEEAQKAKDEGVLGSHSTNASSVSIARARMDSDKNVYTTNYPLSSHAQGKVSFVTALSILAFLSVSFYLKRKI